MEEFLQKLKKTLESVEGIDTEAIITEFKQEVATLELERQTAIIEKEKINSKKNELLGEIKKKNLTIAEYEGQKEEYSRLKEDEERRLKDPTQKINIDEVKQRLDMQYKQKLEKLEETIQKKNETIDGQNKYINDSMKESTIETLLSDGAPVVESYKPMLKKSFLSDAIVEFNEIGDRVVYMSDGQGGLIPAKDFFDGWKSSNDAKPYLKALATNGGGAFNNRIKNGTFNKTKDKEYYNKHLSEKMKLFREDRTVYDGIFGNK